MKTWWVVRHRMTGDYVSPNRRMVPSLLGAGVWDEERAECVRDVDAKKRCMLRLVDALRLDPAFAVGSVVEMVARAFGDPELSEERPDGYLFVGEMGAPTTVMDLEGVRIGEVHSFGYSEALELHPAALAHARWRVAGGAGMVDPRTL